MLSLGVIVARGPSKRIPRKVLRPLLGVPLIGYMARAALASRIDRVILSTEDEEIAQVGRSFGLEVPFLRPAELAGDFVCNDDVVLYMLERIEEAEGAGYDIAVLLQPTTPFVLPRHIDACLGTLGKTDAACCFTAKKVVEPPHWMFTTADDGTVKLLLGGSLAGDRQHSQKLPACYLPSGAAWAVRTSVLRKTRRLYSEPMRIAVVEPERAVDIDNPLDLIIAEAVGREFGFGLVPATQCR
ncbi:MAG: acylneuraminate cytidylyltransferase family protein [Kiloniellales bacterium]